MTFDPYETLGVTREATADDIKAAYRAAAKESHPDAGGCANAMADINRAYEILSDPVKRAAHDRGEPENMQAHVDAVVVKAFELARTRVDSFDPGYFGRDPDPLSSAVNICTLAIEQWCRDIGELEAKIATTMPWLTRITRTTEGPNLFIHHFEKLIASERANIAELDRRIKIHKAAIEVLKEYKIEAPPSLPNHFGRASSRMLNTLETSGMGSQRYVASMPRGFTGDPSK